MTICPQGHAVENPGAHFCPACGASLQAVPRADVAVCAVHPDRAAQGPCPRCGTFSCAECLQPGPSGQMLCPDCRARETHAPLPWDERERIGTLRAYWRTSWMFITSPQRTAGIARPTGTMGSSLLFALLAQLASIVTTAVLYGLGIGVFGAIMMALVERKSGETSPGLMAGIGIAFGVGLIVFTVLTGIAGLLISAALDQLVLKAVGAQPGNYEVTLRASALALAPCLTGLIPVCGLYVFPIWALVLKVLLYKAFHRTTTGRAALGALLVPGIFIVLAGILYAAMFLFTLSAQGKTSSF